MTRCAWPVVVLAMLTLLPTGCRWGGSSSTTQSTFERAGEAYLKKDYIGAYTLFRRCRQKGIGKPESGYYEALCLIELGERAKARSRLRSVEDDGDGASWQARVDLAMARAREDDPQKADKLYRELVDDAPSAMRPQVLAAHAEFRQRLGDLAGAGELRRRLALTYPDSSCLPEASPRYAVQDRKLYGQRSEADVQLRKLKSAGFDGVVLPSCGPDREAGYVLQYGSFRKKEGADLLAAKAVKAGFSAEVR